MSIITPNEVPARWAEPFKCYQTEGWVQDWPDNYVAQVKQRAVATREAWCDAAFQEMLWTGTRSQASALDSR